MTPRIFLIIVISLLVAFIPGQGSISFLKYVENLGILISQPITEQEKVELEFLECLEKVAAEIPARSDVAIFAGEDSYLIQRAQDILYPRVRLVNQNESYDFAFYINQDPTGLKVVANTSCSGISVWTVENA